MIQLLWQTYLNWGWIWKLMQNLQLTVLAMQFFFFSLRWVPKKFDFDIWKKVLAMQFFFFSFRGVPKLFFNIWKKVQTCVCLLQQLRFDWEFSESFLYLSEQRSKAEAGRQELGAILHVFKNKEKFLGHEYLRLIHCVWMSLHKSLIMSGRQKFHFSCLVIIKLIRAKARGMFFLINPTNS